MIGSVSGLTFLTNACILYTLNKCDRTVSFPIYKVIIQVGNKSNVSKYTLLIYVPRLGNLGQMKRRLKFSKKIECCGCRRGACAKQTTGPAKK